MASYFLDLAILEAINGISNAPGTHAISISSSFMSWRFKQSKAPSNSLDDINSLNLETTIPILVPLATNFPL